MLNVDLKFYNPMPFMLNVSGKQTPVFECIVTDKNVAVEETFCSDIPRPVAEITECNYGPCPPEYDIIARLL